MILNDKFDITDSLVRGFVVLKDQNDNIIFKKSNMVVGAGRDAIFNTIRNAFKNNNNIGIDKEGSSFSHFTKISFGNGNEMTTPETASIKEIIDDSGKVIYSVNIDETDEDSNDDTDDISVEMSSISENNIRRIDFEITVPSTTPAEITELGLFFKLENNEEHLFSRVVFDPIFCGANAAITELKLHYYLYF